jgi:hypothetical protein
MNFARIHADAGSLSARPMLSEILFISFAIEQEKKINFLERRVNELEKVQKIEVIRKERFEIGLSKAV